MNCFSFFDNRKRFFSLQMLDGAFILTFTYKFQESLKATTYFAFCYPFSYTECQEKLDVLENNHKTANPDGSQGTDIYFHRELLCKSLENRRIDLITVSSHLGISKEQEERLANLFPDVTSERAFKFCGKKVGNISFDYSCKFFYLIPNIGLG